MLILFDQATPLPLRAHLAGHSVRSAWEQGWDQLRNGDLIRAAEEAGFDLILTTDKNMAYQQTLTGRKIAIAVLSRQQWPALKPHLALVVKGIESASPGGFTQIEIPEDENADT